MRSFYEMLSHINQSNMEDTIISMYRNKYKIQEIKQATNVSIGKIYRTLENFGIKSNRFRKDHDLINYYHGTWNVPVEEIAKFTNYSTRWIREVIKREA